MNDPVENLSDAELLTIIRAAENTDVSGSRYQKAKTEWEIRHQQATLEAMKSSEKPSFVHIAYGARVKGLTMRGNKMIGGGDFIKDEGELEDATLDNNKHIIPRRKNNESKSKESGINWQKCGTVVAIVGILVTIILDIFI